VQRVNPRRVVALLRRGLILYTLLALGYLVWRFEVLTLPQAGCSPLTTVRPGAHLFVDGHARRYHEGDMLLFRDGTGRVLLARVAPRPDSVAPGLGVAPGLWVLSDDPDCPSPDSRTLGPIPRERWAGRVLFAFSW
jgi:hypothetical protein